MSFGSRHGLTVLLTILAVATGVVLTPLSAQQANTGDAQKRFQALYAAGDYMAALAEAQQAETAAKRSGTNKLEYLLALNDLARAHQALGHYGEAADRFKQVLAAVQKNDALTQQSESVTQKDKSNSRAQV